MVEIHFSSAEMFAFLRRNTDRLQSITSFQVNEAEFSYSVEDLIIGELIARLNSGLPTILPIVRDYYDEWVIIAASQTDLDQTLQQMNRFLLPTFGIYPENSIFPRLEMFSRPPIDISNKYYSWQSPHSLRPQILASLGLWLQVIKRIPSLEQMLPPTFKELYRQFRFAITNYRWTEAEQIIGHIQHNNLTPSHNIAFLKIELFAQQEDYARIWNDVDLKKWVLHSVPIPRRVQVALLKAFHHQALLQDEQNKRYDAVLMTLRREQSSLGKLLLSRHDIIDDIVVRVFGYLAVLNKAGESIAILSQISTLDVETSTILSALQDMIQPISPKGASERFHELFNEKNYEIAYEVAQGIEVLNKRVSALILSAAILEDELRASEVIRQYDQLSKGDQVLILHEPFVKFALKQLHELVPKIPDVYKDWLSWFEAIFEGADTNTLYRSLEYIEENSDKEYWTLKRTEDLFGYLGSMTFNPKTATSDDKRIARQTYFERAMNWLINQFVVEDHDFPREQNIFGDIYNTFFEYMLHLTPVREESADRVFRLADDRFSRNPDKNHDISLSLFHWLGIPRPDINKLAQEAFELSIQYGVGKEYLYNIYSEWIDRIIDTPVHYDVSTLEVWNSLGHWFGTGASHLTRLVQQRLDTLKSTAVDPIAKLPDNYRIVIYTLDETSAKRVEQLLLERQPTLRIALYTEKSATDRMNTLTQNADMHVIVWRCMKHNVYYKIKSYITDPVLPTSRGSSSILAAIEEYAEKLL